jgi:hypothetical protein
LLDFINGVFFTFRSFFDYTTDKLDRLEQMVNCAEIADKHSPSKAINAIMQKLGTEADVSRFVNLLKMCLTR